MRELDQQVISLKSDPQGFENFIRQKENFILSIASKVSKRYISKSDDEWAIALEAFSDAITKYNYDKGGFIAFSELLLTRRLIDFHRSKTRRLTEVSIDTIEELPNTLEPTDQLTLEISMISDVLKTYGFTFMDLTSSSPKASKTKLTCIKAVNYIQETPLLIINLHHTKQLPMNIISQNTGISKKILDRHRKYIIAVTEIISGDYPHLLEYLRDYIVK